MTDRPTLLLLPGNMCDERLWRGVLPELNGWHVQQCLPTEDSIHEMAQTCLDRTPGPLIPVGFSMGAIIALSMANISPERIAAIALIDTNAGADRPDRANVRHRQQKDVMAGKLETVVLDELAPVYFASGNRNDEKLRSLVLKMALDIGPDVFCSQSEALRTRPDQRHVMPTLNVASFIACGEEDAICSPDLHRELSNTAMNSELHIVPDAGHMLPMEQPEALGKLLSHWLNRIDL